MPIQFSILSTINFTRPSYVQWVEWTAEVAVARNVSPTPLTSHLVSFCSFLLFTPFQTFAPVSYVSRRMRTCAQIYHLSCKLSRIVAIRTILGYIRAHTWALPRLFSRFHFFFSCAFPSQERKRNSVDASPWRRRHRVPLQLASLASSYMNSYALSSRYS